MVLIRRILAVIAVILLIILILGFIAPKEYTLTRTANVIASKGVVMEQVSSLKSMANWAPWFSEDSSTVFEFEGMDGTVGSQLRWDGRENAGKGTQKLISIEPLKRTVTEVRFFKPWDALLESTVELADADKGTDISWSIRGKTSFPFNILSLVHPMEEKVGPELDISLVKLLEICQLKVKEEKYKGYDIRTLDMPAHNYIGIRKELHMSEIPAFYGEAYSTVLTFIADNKVEAAGPPTGLYFTFDEMSNISEVVAAIPIIDSASTEVIEWIQLDTAEAVMIDYYGDYRGISTAYEAIQNYLTIHQRKARMPVIEEYITDPLTQADTSLWLTRLIFRLH